MGLDMGAVYRKVEPIKQKGRYIYNRNRLHKVGFKPKHKFKYRCLRLAHKIEISAWV
jgi:hypothetical protein